MPFAQQTTQEMIPANVWKRECDEFSGRPQIKPIFAPAAASNTPEIISGAEWKGRTQEFRRQQAAQNKLG